MDMDLLPEDGELAAFAEDGRTSKPEENDFDNDDDWVDDGLDDWCDALLSAREFMERVWPSDSRDRDSQLITDDKKPLYRGALMQARVDRRSSAIKSSYTHAGDIREWLAYRKFIYCSYWPLRKIVYDFVSHPGTADYTEPELMELYKDALRHGYQFSLFDEVAEAKRDAATYDANTSALLNDLRVIEQYAEAFAMIEVHIFRDWLRNNHRPGTVLVRAMDIWYVRGAIKQLMESLGIA